MPIKTIKKDDTGLFIITSGDRRVYRPILSSAAAQRYGLDSQTRREYYKEAYGYTTAWDNTSAFSDGDKVRANAAANDCTMEVRSIDKTIYEMWFW